MKEENETLQSDLLLSDLWNSKALKLCLDVTLYWTGSAFDHVDGIVDFYNQSMEIIGKNVTFYRTETMKSARPVTSKASWSSSCGDRRGWPLAGRAVSADLVAHGPSAISYRRPLRLGSELSEVEK